MTKLSKRQLHIRKKFLSLQKLLDDNDRYKKKELLWKLLMMQRTAQPSKNGESDEERNDDIFANIHDANLALEKQITLVEKHEIR